MINRSFITCLILVFSGISFEVQSQTTYFNSFKTNNTSGIVLGADAKLTSGVEDPVNEGYLRLTPSGQYKRGFAYIDKDFPSNDGMKVEFEFYTWGGTMADGLTFFLFDPKDGFAIGQYGGALGYAQNNNNGTGLGMKNGFLAVGLDEYGNFGAASESKNGGFKDNTGATYTNAIQANGLVTVRGAVGPAGERDGVSAYPFLGGKITSNTFGSTKAAWPSDILASADQFGISTTGRGPLETDANFRKVRLDIQRVVGTGFVINVEVFVGARGRWIKVLDNFIYNISDGRVPASLKAGFSASTGDQTNNHEVRNVLITPSSAALSTPSAVNDVVNVTKNQVKAINILTNDNTTINPGGSFQAGSVDLDPTTPVIDVTKVVTGGTFTVSNTGILTFTPTNDFTGTVGSISYSFKDSFGIISTSATVSVTVSVSNTLPTLGGVTKSGPEDTPVPFSLADFSLQFTDLDNDGLAKIKVQSLPVNGVLRLNGVDVVLGQEIAAANISNLVFFPNANWNGNTSFKWNGSDGTAYAVLDASVNIEITPVNDTPIVSAISKTGSKNNTLLFVATDFVDKYKDEEQQPLAKVKVLSLPPNGTLKLNGNDVTANQEVIASDLNQLSFLPALNWSGTTSFNWNGSDGTNYALVNASVNITINAVNNLPTVSNIDKAGTEDSPVSFTSINFRTKFNDIDSDPLLKVKIATLPLNGTLKLAGSNVLLNQEILGVDLDNLTFEPNGNWNGNTLFEWNGYDGLSYASNPALVNINIAAVNDLPSVARIDKSGTEDIAIGFSLTDFTQKFIDPDNDLLSAVKIVTLPANGMLKLSGTAVVIDQRIELGQIANLSFVPDANWNGSTTFYWNGSDANGYAATDALVNISIVPVNDAPLVYAIDKTGTEDKPLAFTSVEFTDKFSDLDNDQLSKVKITSLPANGTLKLSGTDVTINQEILISQLNDLTFIPNQNWNGTTSFGWNGSDGASYANTPAIVNISITGVIDDPVAVNDLAETSLDKPVDILIADNDQADGGLTINKASITVMAQPKHGELKVNATGVVTYTPASKYAGGDSFSYMIEDSNGGTSNIATVNITVTGFFISNVFTPNGDGKNDTFVIAGIENYDTTDLIIYNRWGNEVYRNANYSNSWDGFGLNQGTYYFIAKLKKGSSTDIRKGWVLLKR